MSPSSALVTGASSGLGRHVATELARQGWNVILGCRDQSRGAAVAAEINRQFPGASAYVLPMDLASFDSIRAAVASLTDQPPSAPLRALVCNAGIQVVDGVRRTVDGHELTFGTNHLGHFLLINLLLDQLVAPARIVLVSSGTHFGPHRALGFPGPRWADPRVLADPDAVHLGQTAKDGRIRYATSKLANIYTTYELSRRLADQDVTATAFDPGLMPSTGLDRDYPSRTQRIYRRLAPVLVRLVPGARHPQCSATDLAWLVTSAEVADISGRYFVGRRPKRSSKASYDEVLAAQLWDRSHELVGSPARPAPPKLP
ncbi:SDR family NAD(P)-dependent oxidoreductase [Phytoactinopolyspora limicola]|uniref:SDR family NAD(P)-dependent oxidoreductase n=1 Tax=Phytoactinopolyspora limicola TaxID=2715536 RepID=UPI00140779DD|nr:SDR family NAD(P)-dependent oxidoreductase [Phytoactinopolyspora limicola]